MSFVRTVLGDLAAADLGVCYAHEHIIIDPSVATLKFPDFKLESVEHAVTELTQFHRDGGRSMVDSMPCDAGRSVLKLAEISRRSGVHIVCPTGLHLAQYYDNGHWGNRLSEAQLADLFVADILEGIDRHDYSCPTVERTTHRAGVIKVASGLDRLDEREKRVFRAAGETHRRTGAPILTHCEKGTAALEQIECFRAAGVDLTRVVLSHTDRLPDLSYHREVLATGVCLEYDSAFRWKEGAANPTRDLVVSLLHEFPMQILLGMDAARPSYWKSYGGGPGMSFLLNAFSDELIAHGLSQEDLSRIFVSNPARAYSFAEPSEPRSPRTV